MIAAVSVRQAWRDHGRRLLGAAAIVAFVLVNLTKPTDPTAAAVGFVLGGAVLALVAAGVQARDVALLPAIWLPMHLLVAASVALAREVRGMPAQVRTDPPPTAAIVPLVMVIAAYLGGLAVIAVRGRT